MWNLIDAIHTIADAKRIADCWRYASGQPSTGGDDFFPGTAAQQLADYLFAAHLGGKTVADVFRWASSERNTEPVTILTKHEGYGEIAARVSSVIALTPETRSGVFGSLQTMVAFLADPDVIEWIGNGVLDRFLEDESLFGEFLRTPVSEGGVESLVVEPPHIVVEVGA